MTNNKTKTLTSILLAGLLTGCSTYRPHTKTEKVWLCTMIAGQASDYISTERALDMGLVESNPIYGDSLEKVALGKIAISALAIIMG